MTERVEEIRRAFVLGHSSKDLSAEVAIGDLLTALAQAERERDEAQQLTESHAEQAEAREQALRKALDILIAANEKHRDPRCGHCAYALLEARAVLEGLG